MSGINNYFSNNNIFNGTEIPTQGKFDVGDIVINIGENAEEEPMWMCIEAGEPGVWKVVGKVEEIDLSGYQEKTDGNLVTESKDLVGAINELFQNANNGKELIASAIGEPVSSEDTFSAMSSDINGLLSTFKTNMLNNGITVESSDKFKQLIDKIATIAEEGSGKGIQFEMGTDTINIIDSGSAKTKTVSGLKFIPTYVFCFVQGKVWHEDDELDVGYTIRDLVFGSMGETYWDSGAGYFKVTINDNNSFTIQTYLHGSTYEAVGETDFTWYAIGVGEEDTTLRDSLASILQGEGVSVTEEDDMASLISKVDSEFNRQVVPAGNAVASNVLTGKTFINSTGGTITGTMANNGIKTITPSASTQTLGAGYYDNITINGDADLVAANIVSGKNIFGVAGTAQTALTTAAGTSKQLVLQKSMDRYDALISSSFYYYADEYNDSPYFDLGYGCYINGSATIIMAFNVIKGSQLGYSCHIDFKFTNIATNESYTRVFSGKKGDGSNVSFNITDMPAGIYKIQLSYSPSSDYSGTYEFYLNYFSVCYS